MKKFLLFLLVFSVALFSTFANGGQEEPTEGVEIEVAIFDGGYGISYYEACAREMELTFPGIKVNVWGSPRISEELRPRFIGGNPPDFANYGGPEGVALVKEGQVSSLNELLESKAHGQDVKFIDTFMAGALIGGNYGGEYYFGPSEVGMSGLWYDAKLFRDQGWSVPETWEEFLALSEDIKAAGYNPLTYQGIYAGYMDMVATPLMYKTAGMQAIYDIDNLVPGAWKNPDIIKGLQLLQDFVSAPGNVLDGTEGLNHTGSQMEWLNRNAVFIPCGTWLENEMRDVTPDDFEMALMSIPGPSDGKGDNTAMSSWFSMGYMIPAQAKNVKWGLEYFKIVYSQKMAKVWAETMGSVLPVKGGTEGVTISKPLATAIELIEATDNIIAMKYGGWYPTISKIYNDNIADYMWGRLSVEDLTDMLEEEAQKVAANPDIDKFVRE